MHRKFTAQQQTSCNRPRELAARLENLRALESIHLTRQAGVLEEGVVLRAVAARWAGTRRDRRKRPTNKPQHNKRRRRPPPRGRRTRPHSCHRAERDPLLSNQDRGTRCRLDGRLTVSSCDMGFWGCGHFGIPYGSDWLPMSCRRCPRMDGIAVRGTFFIFGNCFAARRAMTSWSLSSAPRIILLEGSELTAESKAVRDACGCMDSLRETLCHCRPEGIVVTTTMFWRQNRSRYGAA